MVPAVNDIDGVEIFLEEFACTKLVLRSALSRFR